MIEAALIYFGGRLLSKALGGSGSAPASATCRWCSNPLKGNNFSHTTCCQSKLCPSCQPEWKRAGGNNCVLCGHHHTK
jgi:hypothetical protein